MHMRAQILLMCYRMCAWAVILVWRILQVFVWIGYCSDEI